MADRIQAWMLDDFAKNFLRRGEDWVLHTRYTLESLAEFFFWVNAFRYDEQRIDHLRNELLRIKNEKKPGTHWRSTNALAQYYEFKTGSLRASILMYRTIPADVSIPKFKDIPTSEAPKFLGSVSKSYPGAIMTAPKFGPMVVSFPLYFTDNIVDTVISWSRRYRVEVEAQAQAVRYDALSSELADLSRKIEIYVERLTSDHSAPPLRGVERSIEELVAKRRSLRARASEARNDITRAIGRENIDMADHSELYARIRGILSTITGTTYQLCMKDPSCPGPHYSSDHVSNYIPKIIGDSLVKLAGHLRWRRIPKNAGDEDKQLDADLRFVEKYRAVYLPRIHNDIVRYWSEVCDRLVNHEMPLYSNIGSVKRRVTQ